MLQTRCNSVLRFCVRPPAGLLEDRVKELDAQNERLMHLEAENHTLKRKLSFRQSVAKKGR